MRRNIVCRSAQSEYSFRGAAKRLAQRCLLRWYIRATDVIVLLFKKKPDTLEACRVGIQTHIGSLEETMQSTKNYYTKTTFFLMTESNFRYNQRRKLLRVSRSAGS
jgi:hypothetical protein